VPLAFPFRPAVAYLRRSSLRHNLKTIRAQLVRSSPLHSPRTKIMGVVKADAYGHFATQMLPQLEREGITQFCVASLEEAVEIRKISKSSRVLVLGGILHWSRKAIDIVSKSRLEVGINDMASLKLFLPHKNIKIHLKLDTGMNRLGIKSDEWSEVLGLIKKSGRELEGLYTHYASFEGASFRNQVLLFEEAVRWFENERISVRWIHSENSAALFSKAKLRKGILSERGNLVRPGISMYGYMPSNFKTSVNLRPVLQLVAEIDLVKRVHTGEGMSYDHLYRAKNTHDYGVIPVGYADGVAKSYASRLMPLWLDRKGKKKGQLSICGAICMDMLMLRASRGKLQIKDQVVLWGQGVDQLVKTKVADPYELNLRIAKRIPRIWTE